MRHLHFSFRIEPLHLAAFNPDTDRRLRSRKIRKLNEHLSFSPAGDGSDLDSIAVPLPDFPLTRNDRKGWLDTLPSRFFWGSTSGHGRFPSVRDRRRVAQNSRGVLKQAGLARAGSALPTG